MPRWADRRCLFTFVAGTPHFVCGVNLQVQAQERRDEVDAARMFLWILRAEVRRQRDALAASTEGSYPPASLEPWTTWLERTLQAERDLDLLIPADQVLAACLVQLV